MKKRKEFYCFKLSILALMIIVVGISCSNIGIGDQVELRTVVGANLVTNPGFESLMTGWSTEGTSAADYAQTDNPYSGSYNLCHWRSSSWEVRTYQTLSGLDDGLYTFSVMARNWDTDVSQIQVSGYGGSTLTADITSSSWTRITISDIPVTSGEATISLYTSSTGGCSVFDDVQFYLTDSDVSSGAIEILSDHGFEYARIRLLVEPGDAYGLHQDLEYVIETAKRAKAAGMEILLDIFYSHWWCDPGQNWKPESWSSTYSNLYSKVYSYTAEVMQAMDNADVRPAMVQVGNEVNDGMLWTTGQISVNGWSNYVNLSNQGYWGVKSLSSDIPVIIHYAGIGDDAVTWYSNFVSNGGLLDAAGISFYEMWHGSISDCVSTVDQLSSNLGTDVYVVETAAYWKASEGGNTTSYAHTEQGQYDFLYDLTEALQDSTVDGLFYWGATWTQADLWLDAPYWEDDDAGCRGLFDDNGAATSGIDAIFDAGGLGIVGVDVSEALWAESCGVTYSN